MLHRVMDMYATMEVVASSPKVASPSVIVRQDGLVNIAVSVSLYFKSKTQSVITLNLILIELSKV